MQLSLFSFQFAFIALALVTTTRAAACTLPSGNDIVSQINTQQTVEIESQQALVDNLYYNCFRWDSSLQQVERFIVSVELSGSPAKQRWLFNCSTGSSFSARLVAGVAVLVNVSTMSYGCGECDEAAADPCVACDSSCKNNRCYGTNATDCCNYIKNNMCVIDCGTNFVPNAQNNCICANSFTGSDCSTCSLACVNGSPNSTCSSCSCSAGFTGRLCGVQLDGCDSNPCMNGGTCLRTNEGGFSCTCPSKFTDSLCQTSVSCLSIACLHGGTVVKSADGACTCSCTEYFTGSQCLTRVHVCKPDSCQNGGTCSPTAIGFDCVCQLGFRGSDCSQDVDECTTSRPCSNGGRCMNRFGGYECDCQPGFTGDDCDVPSDVCSKSPTYCGENGRCMTEPYVVNPYGRELELEPVSTDGSMSYCDCSDGFYGNQCGNSVSSCGEGSCANGGECTQVDGVVRCGCVGNWKGSVCSTCGMQCVHGSLDENCTTCTCQGNWTGDSCSVCNDFIEETKCVKSCMREGNLPHTHSQGQKWCFPCGIFLCEQCNYDDVFEVSDHQCRQCIPGARLDRKNEGHCTIEPDTEDDDDKSSSNNTGLIVGITIGVISFCVVLAIVAYVMYRKFWNRAGDYQPAKSI